MKDRHVTKQALRYVQIYEGTQRHVTKQALRYVQLYDVLNPETLYEIYVPMKTCD